MKEYEVPKIWEAALSFIDDQLSRVMWNIHEKDWLSPFENTNNSFSCPIFSVSSRFNFKWRNVEISWYKYFGRGMTANRLLSAEEAEIMLEEVLDFLNQMDNAKKTPSVRQIAKDHNFEERSKNDKRRAFNSNQKRS